MAPCRSSVGVAGALMTFLCSYWTNSWATSEISWLIFSVIVLIFWTWSPLSGSWLLSSANSINGQHTETVFLLAGWCLSTCIAPLLQVSQACGALRRVISRPHQTGMCLIYPVALQWIILCLLHHLRAGVFICFELARVLSVLPVSWVHTYISPVVSWRHVSLGHPPPLVLTVFQSPLQFPGLEGGGVWRLIGWSRVSSSLQWPVVSLCVNLHLQQENLLYKGWAMHWCMSIAVCP